MKASIEVQNAVYSKCLELPLHNIKALASTQLKDTDERKEVYQAFLDGWKPDVVEVPPIPLEFVTKPSDEYVARKYIQIMENAERRGKEFSLTLSDVRKLLSTKTCAYTGVKLYKQPAGVSEKQPHIRTFDRLDANIGYTKANVYAVSNIANQIKNVLFEDETSIVKIEFKEMMKMMNTLNKLGVK